MSYEKDGIVYKNWNAQHQIPSWTSAGRIMEIYRTTDNLGRVLLNQNWGGTIDFEETIQRQEEMQRRNRR